MTDNQYAAAEGLTARLSPLAGMVMFAFLVAGLVSVLWAMFISDKVALQPTQPPVGWRLVIPVPVCVKAVRTGCF